MFHQCDNRNILVKKRERKPNSLFRLEEGYGITRLTNKIVYPNHLVSGKITNKNVIAVLIENYFFLLRQTKLSR